MTLPRHAEQIDDDVLNPRQLKLVDEFMISGNKTDAFRKAGYTVPDDSRKLARRVNATFKVPAVLQEIARRKNDVALTAGVRLDDVVEEIKKIAFANMQDYTTLDAVARIRRIDLSRCTPEQLAAVSEITTEEDIIQGDEGGPAVLQRRVRIKLHPKLEALIRLGTWLNADEILPAKAAGDSTKLLPAPRVEQLTPDEAARRYREFLKIGA